MNKVKDVTSAINVLIKAAQAGQSAGAYKLGDAAVIAGAIVFLESEFNDPKTEQVEDEKPE